MLPAISVRVTEIWASVVLAARDGIGCSAQDSGLTHEQLKRLFWQHMIFVALVNKGPSKFKAALMICSALFLLFSVCHGDATEAAPGQFVGGRLTLESDGGADVFLEAPDSVSDWVLVPSASPNVKQMALKVTSSTDWQMTVSSDRPDGRMAEYDLTASEYVPGGRTLESPLMISSSGTDDHPGLWEVNLPEGGMIHRGGETSENGLQVLVTLGQRVGWTDEPLEEGQAYRIALTFTVSPSG